MKATSIKTIITFDNGEQFCEGDKVVLKVKYGKEFIGEIIEIKNINKMFYIGVSDNIDYISATALNLEDIKHFSEDTEARLSTEETNIDLKAFAKKLTGRDYYDYPQIPKDLVEFAKNNNIVIVYGASDDLMEFEGAIYDEAGCFDGGKVYFDKNGVKENAANMIEAVWCDKERIDENGNVITWTYKTDVPHEIFMIYDGSEPYCEGIVFKLSNLK